MFDFFKKNNNKPEEKEKNISYNEHEDFSVSSSFYNVMCSKMDDIKDKLIDDTYDAFAKEGSKYDDFAEDYVDKNINCVKLALNVPMIGTPFIAGMIEVNDFLTLKDGIESIWEILTPDEWRVLKDCVKESETRAKAINEAMPIIDKFMKIWEEDWIKSDYPLSESFIKNIISSEYEDYKDSSSYGWKLNDDRDV